MRTGNSNTPVADAAPGRDRFLLTAARTIRGFGAGALSVVLAIELSRGGYSGLEIGGVLGLAMGAAAGWAILMPGRLPGLSRGSLFLLGAVAVAAGGVLLWYDVSSPWALLPALLLGGIVAGGADISPLGALEQGTLSGVANDLNRTRYLVEYKFAG